MVILNVKMAPERFSLCSIQALQTQGQIFLPIFFPHEQAGAQNVIDNTDPILPQEDEG